MLNYIKIELHIYVPVQDDSWDAECVWYLQLRTCCSNFFRLKLALHYMQYPYSHHTCTDNEVCHVLRGLTEKLRMYIGLKGAGLHRELLLCGILMIVAVMVIISSTVTQNGALTMFVQKTAICNIIALTRLYLTFLSVH